MNLKSEDQKYKQVSISDSRLIGIQTNLSFKMFLAYEKLDHNYDSERERFRELICNGEIIEGFSQDDYKKISESDLGIIAGEILEKTKSPINLNETVYTNLFFEMDRQLIQFKESVTQSFKAFQKSFIETEKTLYDLNKNLGNLLTQLTSQIHSMAIQWQDTVNNILVNRREYLGAKEKASLIASKYDWFIAYDFNVSKEFYDELVKLDNSSSDNNKLDIFFTNYYGMDLRKQIISDLYDFDASKEYKEIITQIEYGYDQKLYYLIIPAIFTLIEGIIARGFQHKGQMNGTQLKVYIKDLLNTDETKSLQEIINNRMLVSFEHGKEVDSPISRHAILHGGDLKFGTEAVALRLLLIFYNLAFAFSLRDIMEESE